MKTQKGFTRLQKAVEKKLVDNEGVIISVIGRERRGMSSAALAIMDRISPLEAAIHVVARETIADLDNKVKYHVMLEELGIPEVRL